MNNAYLERAKAVIPDPQILSVVAPRRARQLALGARPMVKCDSPNHLDVALLEIAEGLLTYYFEGEEPKVKAVNETTEFVSNDEVADMAAEFEAAVNEGEDA